MRVHRSVTKSLSWRKKPFSSRLWLAYVLAACILTAFVNHAPSADHHHGETDCAVCLVQDYTGHGALPGTPKDTLSKISAPQILHWTIGQPAWVTQAFTYHSARAPPL